MQLRDPHSSSGSFGPFHVPGEGARSEGHRRVGVAKVFSTTVWSSSPLIDKTVVFQRTSSLLDEQVVGQNAPSISSMACHLEENLEFAADLNKTCAEKEQAKRGFIMHNARCLYVLNSGHGFYEFVCF